MVLCLACSSAHTPLQVLRLVPYDYDGSRLLDVIREEEVRQSLHRRILLRKRTVRSSTWRNANTIHSQLLFLPRSLPTPLTPWVC